MGGLPLRQASNSVAPEQKYFYPGCVHGPCDSKEHYFDMEKDPDNKHPLPNRWFKNKDGDLFYKGRKCRDFTDDEY